MEKILEKIAKLQKMQESAAAIGNDAEAMAFAARIQKMLIQYKLDMSQVEDFDLDAKDNFKVEKEFFNWQGAGINSAWKRCSWLEYLAGVVCKYNNCKFLVWNGTNSIVLVGTQESRAVVNYMLNVLARFGKDEMDRKYRKAYYQAKKAKATYLMKGWRKSFINAYVSRIAERMEAEWRRIQAEVVTERGLMVLDQEKAAVEDFLNNMDLRDATKLNHGSIYNKNGAVAGAATGDNAHIKSNGINEDGSRIHAICGN